MIRVLPYGTAALLAEADDAQTVLPLAAAARALPGVVDVVPAARTVLVVLADATQTAGVATRLRELTVDARAAGPGAGGEVVLEVHYDGDDLATTAAEVGLDVDGLVRAHTAGDYVVAFCGFAPGFAYLTGLAPALHVARLADPRTRVPAGSVAIADEFSGVYPTPSPGGWRLLGHTGATLWDLDRDPPALLLPGTRVRFRAADSHTRGGA